MAHPAGEIKLTHYKLVGEAQQKASAVVLRNAMITNHSHLESLRQKNPKNRVVSRSPVEKGVF